MSCIHYKFKSNRDYSTLTFDGLHITLGDLKKLIIQKQKLGKSPDFDLQVTNAQTKEVYKNDDELIPKNASVIVSRAPLGASSKALGTATEASASPSQGEPATSVSNRMSFEQLSQTPDLVNASASEDDKIRAMIFQSTQDYDQSNYMKSKYPTGRPHAGYVCHKCGQTGHFVATCPNKGLENDMPRIKRSTGIPQSFMKVVDNPNMPGAMVTNDGHFVVPIIDAEAYRLGKKEKPPFLEPEKNEPVEEEKNIPGELLCSLCKDILKDAVVIQCCGNSFCDECVREKLLESEDHMCPQCKETGVSPDSLIPNTYLRKLVINFENETGYIKPARRNSVDAMGDASKVCSQASSQSQMPPRSTPYTSGAYRSQQQNSMPQSSSASQYQGIQASMPMSTSQQTAPASSQIPTSIPASLIGLPPHVIKAHLREMEKAKQASSQQDQQKTQQYATSTPSTHSYPQTTQRMSESYSAHQSQSGMVISQRPPSSIMMPPTSSNVARSIVPSQPTPSTPTMDENRATGPQFPLVNINGTAVASVASHMQAPGQVMAPTHVASAMTLNLGSTVSMMPQNAHSSLVRPGQVPYVAPTSATAAIPRPYMTSPAGQMPPASVHAGSAVPQVAGAPANYITTPSPWQQGQPRPGYQVPVPPGYPPHSGIPPGGIPPQGVPPRMSIPPHPASRPPAMVGGPGYRGLVQPVMTNGPPGLGPLVPPRYPANRPRPMTEEEFYREKERLLREQEKARRDKDRDRDRIRIEEEHLRMIEREKKRERDLDSMAQEFIDAKGSRKRTRSRSWSRSLSRSLSRSRSRSRFSRARSRNKTLKRKSGSRSPRLRSRSHSRSIRPRSRSPRPISSRSPRPLSPRSPRPASRSPRAHSSRSPRRSSRSPRPRSSRSPRPRPSRSPRPRSSRSPRPRSSRSPRPRSSRSPRPRSSRSPRPRSSRSPRPLSSRSPRPRSSRSPRPRTLRSPRPCTSRSPRPRNSMSPLPCTSRSPRPHSSRSPRPHLSVSPRPCSSRSPRPHSSRSPRPHSPKSPRIHSPRLARLRSPRSSRPRSPRSSRLHSPTRMRSPRLHSPSSRSPKPYHGRSVSPRPHLSRRGKSPRPHSPYSRSRSFTPSPRRTSYSRSWSRTPERHPPSWSPRRSRSPARRSWSRSPPTYHRQRSRSPIHYRRGRRDSPLPHRKYEYPYGHHRSPTRDKYATYSSPSRFMDHYRNPEQYDPRWIEYYRHYYEWYERYGELYGYPPVPAGMPRDHSPEFCSSRSHRHRSRSPSKTWAKVEGKKVKERRSDRAESVEPREYSRKRKLKSSREKSIKEQYSDTEEKGRKTKTKKKRMSVERTSGREYTNSSSHESDMPQVKKHHAKEAKEKSESKHSYNSDREQVSKKSSRHEKSKMAAEDDVSDTEHIKTLSIKREPSYAQNDEPYTRKRDLIQIVTESFEDTKGDGSSQISESTAKDPAEQVQPEQVKSGKHESLPLGLSESEIKEKPREKSSEPCPEVHMESKTKPLNKDKVKSDGRSSSKETEMLPKPKEDDTCAVPIRKAKDGTKTKMKKSKDKEKSEKLEKIEMLQAEIRRLERQQEEKLMVAPPELSRWERDDSGQESDSKDHQRTRVSSSISKPSLPKHVLESAEKAITQKPRGVMSIASAISPASSKSSGSSTRRVIVEKARDSDRSKEKSPLTHMSVDVRDSREVHHGRRVLSDNRHMQVTISAVSDSKPTSSGLKEKDDRILISRKDKDWDPEVKKNTSDTRKDAEYEKSHKIKLQREVSREMLPPKSTRNSDKETKGLERKLSVMDESAFEPDYEEDLNEEGLGSSNDTESTVTDKEMRGRSPAKKHAVKDLKPTEKSEASHSPSRSTSPTSDREQKHKHKKKKHKHKHKKHKKQKSVDKEK